MTEAISSAHPTHFRPGFPRSRPVSFVGWSVAVLVGLALWAIGLLLIF